MLIAVPRLGTTKDTPVFLNIPIGEMPASVDYSISTLKFPCSSGCEDTNGGGVQLSSSLPLEPALPSQGALGSHFNCMTSL
jgi:hypothetical protein